MQDTRSLLLPSDFPAINRTRLDTLQVNLGYRCNQRCLHCHVNAGPTRKEMMSPDMIDLVIEVSRQKNIKTLDLTGGAPELHDDFRYLVTTIRKLGIHVIDRCNLTILSEPGQETLAEFLANQQVEVVASLPCYSVDNVDKQRGNGVFVRSIIGLRQLNQLGYGKGNQRLPLNLVYNPQEGTLPPPQAPLEADYKQRLLADFDIVFDHLYVITNMPIQRFGSTLHSRGQFADYIRLLKSAHLDSNVDSVMCRQQLSVDWQGYLYNCDFNQMLKMPALTAGRLKPHLKDLLTQSRFASEQQEAIAIADHCYGCTAGQGSSCSGAHTTQATADVIARG